jgi:hypothetical protein
MRIYPAILIRCDTLLTIFCAVPLQAQDDSAAVMSGGYRSSLHQESFMLETSLQLLGAGDGSRFDFSSRSRGIALRAHV